MNLEEIKSKLESINTIEDLGLNVYFLLEKDGVQVLKRANIIEDVKDGLIASYKNSLKKIIENDELALINLSAADDRKNAFYKYDLENEPSIFNFFETIKNQDQQPDYFSFENDKLSDLEGYFVRFGSYENNILIYRKQMAVNLFKQGKIYLIKGHETQFTKIDKEFLRIDTKIDIINIDSNIYINNISVLERHYEFNDIIIAEAKSSLESIAELKILDNIEVLTERVTDVKFARKLSKISTISPVFKLERKVIIAFVNGHKSLSKAFKYTDDGNKILLDTKVSQNFFLKLMNDDFLHSQLTKFDYLTPAKDKL